MADEIGGIEAQIRLDGSEKVETDLRKVQAGLDVTAAKMGALATATHRVDTAMATVSKGTNTAGSGMMQLAFFLDDAQYGMKGIVNNIPMLLTSLGVGTGLAGVVSIAAVGIGVLIEKWDSLTEAFQVGIPAPALEGLDALNAKLKSVTDQINKLRSGGNLSLKEIFELEGLEGERARLTREAGEARELQGIMGTRSQAAQERGQGFKAAVGAVGGGNAINVLIAALERRMDASGKVFDDVSGTAMDPKALAEEMFRRAGRGEAGATEAIRGALGGKGMFAEKIDELSPEAKAAAKEREQQIGWEIEGRKNAKNIEDKIKENAAKEREQQIEWEIEGRKNAKAMEKRVKDVAEEEEKRQKDIADRIKNALADLAPEKRFSQVMDIGSLSSSVQSSIASGMGEVEKKQLKALEELNKALLERIVPAIKEVNNVRVVK